MRLAAAFASYLALPIGASACSKPAEPPPAPPAAATE
jgi:hypothetical protein